VAMSTAGPSTSRGARRQPRAWLGEGPARVAPPETRSPHSPVGSEIPAAAESAAGRPRRAASAGRSPGPGAPPGSPSSPPDSAAPPRSTPSSRERRGRAEVTVDLQPTFTRRAPGGTTRNTFPTCMITNNLPYDVQFYRWRLMVVDGPKRPSCGPRVGTANTRTGQGCRYHGSPLELSGSVRPLCGRPRLATVSVLPALTITCCAELREVNPALLRTVSSRASRCLRPRHVFNGRDHRDVLWPSA
jgi:hypothetical protein